MPSWVRTDAAADRPRAWLVGVRLDAESAGAPDLYTLYLDAERPVATAGSIIFISDPALAGAALARDDDPAVRDMAIPDQVEIVYDVPMALYLIASENVDRDAIVVNVLNVLFDLLKATGVPWIASVKDVLYPFADHLTFSQEFGTYLDAVSGRRQEVVNAVLWGIGAVASHATVLRDADPG